MENQNPIGSNTAKPSDPGPRQHRQLGRRERPLTALSEDNPSLLDLARFSAMSRRPPGTPVAVAPRERHDERPTLEGPRDGTTTIERRVRSDMPEQLLAALDAVLVQASPGSEGYGDSRQDLPEAQDRPQTEADPQTSRPSQWPSPRPPQTPPPKAPQ